MRCENCGNLLKKLIPLNIDDMPDVKNHANSTIAWECDNCGQTLNEIVKI